jgi:hypothetical protein
MFWRAAAGLATARALRDAGYRVGLTGIQIVARSGSGGYGRGSGDKAGDNYSVVVIRLVEAGQPISIETVAAAVAHGGVFRTCGFVAGMADIPLNLGQNTGYWGLGQICTGRA